MSVPYKNLTNKGTNENAEVEPKPKQWTGYDQTVEGEPLDVNPLHPSAIPWPAPIPPAHKPMKLK